MQIQREIYDGPQFLFFMLFYQKGIMLYLGLCILLFLTPGEVAPSSIQVDFPMLCVFANHRKYHQAKKHIYQGGQKNAYTF